MSATKNRYQRYIDALLENKLLAAVGLSIAALSLIFGLTETSLKFRSAILGMSLVADTVRIQEEASGATAVVIAVNNSSELPKTVRTADIKIIHALSLDPCGDVPISGAAVLKEHVLNPADVDKRVSIEVNATIPPKSVSEIKLLFLSTSLDKLYKLTIDIDQIGSIGEFSFFFPDLFVSSLIPKDRRPPFSPQYTPCQQQNARNLLSAPTSSRENFHLAEARLRALRVPGALEKEQEASKAGLGTIREISIQEAEKSGVLLVYFTDGKETAKAFHCNAGLLSTQEGKVYVATAAHCLVNRITGKRYDDSQIVIKTPTGKIIPTGAIVPFEYRPNSTDRDIAFIELKR